MGETGQKEKKIKGHKKGKKAGVGANSFNSGIREADAGGVPGQGAGQGGEKGTD